MMTTSKLMMTTSDMTDVGRLRHKYSAADCQALLAVLMGTTCPPAQVPELVAAAVNGSASFVRTHVAKHVTVDFPALVRKLRAETPANLDVLQRCIEAACNIETGYLVRDAGVPNIHALRRVGLVAPSGPAAWGLAIVSTKDFVGDEWVLRDDPNDVPTIHGSVEELCRQIVELTHQRRGSTAPADFNSQMKHRFYAVAKLTGWFNFRVEERDGGQVSVVEIKTRDLFDDICRGECPNLVIQGVNAPPFAR
jgi:hypothetical protein